MMQTWERGETPALPGDDSDQASDDDRQARLHQAGNRQGRGGSPDRGAGGAQQGLQQQLFAGGWQAQVAPGCTARMTPRCNYAARRTSHVHILQQGAERWGEIKRTFLERGLNESSARS